MNAAIRMRQLQQQANQQQSTNYLQQTTNLFKQFKVQLEEFASLNAKQIDKDPELRKKFTELTNQLGIDPLSSANCVFSKLLSDFYYRLAIKIVAYCEKQSRENVEIDQMLAEFNKKITNQKEKLTFEDVEKALKVVSQLNNTFKRAQLANGKVVITCGKQIYNDQQEQLINFVRKSGKIWFNIDELPEKLRSEVDVMVQYGMLALDFDGKLMNYYVLALY